VLAATEPPDAIAKELGDLASAATVPDAVEAADVLVFAVWFDVLKQLVEQNLGGLGDKVVVDTSNPVAADDKGDFHRTLPEGVSSGSVIPGMLPSSAHFVKASGP
jgi:8-hydroxy-5-deazaflavin:NADPH oxidoreductase